MTDGVGQLEILRRVIAGESLGVTTREFAQREGYSLTGIKWLIREGHLQAQKIRGRYYIPPDALIACIKCGLPRQHGHRYCFICAEASERASHRRSIWRSLKRNFTRPHAVRIR